MGTILEKLEYTNNAVKALRDTKIAKKVGINTSTPLKQIPPLLDSVNLGPDYSGKDINLLSYYTNTDYENFSLPYGFHDGSAVVYNNEIHILGNSTKHYKWNGTSWSEVSTLPYNFYDGSAVVYNNEIHILGSNISSNNTKHYKWDGTSWTEVSTLPYSFYYGQALVYNNEIHILGSRYSGGYTKHYKYNGTSWSEVSTLPYNFYNGSAVVYNNEIHILGGYYRGSSTKHYKYNGVNWSKVSELPYKFYDGSAVVYNNNLYLIYKNGDIRLFNNYNLSWIYLDKFIKDESKTRVVSVIYGSKGIYNFFTSKDNVSQVSIYCADDNSKDILFNLEGFSKDLGELPYEFFVGSAVVYNNEIHILGSADSNNHTKHFKWNGTSWSRVSTLPYNFYNGSAVVYNNEIHILGSNDNPLNSNYDANYQKHYKYNGTSWIEVSTLPYYFSSGQALVYNNEIHILGSDSDPTKHYKYNGASWSKVSTLPYGFNDGSAVVYNNEIHILGSDSSSNLTKHFKWNGTSWIEVSTLPYNFYEGSAVVYNNEIHILGSGSSSNLTKHFKWDGTNWIEVSTLPYEFYRGSAVVYNNEIHILGSRGNSTKHYEYVIDESGNYWSNVSSLWKNFIWGEISTLPYNLGSGQALVYNNEIHILGSNYNTNYTKHYKWNGTSWTEVSTLPYEFYHGQALVYNNEIHILGSNYNSNYTKHYKYTGTSWIEVSELPYDFYNGQALVYNNEIHILGGNHNPIKHFKWNGTSWIEVSELPYDFYNGQALVYNNEIHILGSRGDSEYHYKYNGTSWTEVSTLPYEFYDGQALVYNNEIHILGSNYNSNYTKHYKWNGTSWTEVSTLPYNFYRGSAVVYNNEIHILGSNSNSNYTKHFKWEVDFNIVDYISYDRFSSTINRLYYPKSLSKSDRMNIVKMSDGYYKDNKLIFDNVLDTYPVISTVGKIYTRPNVWDIEDCGLHRSTEIDDNCSIFFESSSSKEVRIPLEYAFVSNGAYDRIELYIYRPADLASAQICTSVGYTNAGGAYLTSATANNKAGTSYTIATFAAATLNRPMWIRRIIQIDASMIMLVYQWQTSDTALSALFARTIFIEDTGNIRLGTERTLFAATNLYNSGLAYTSHKYNFMPARYGKNDYIIYNYLYTNYSSAGVATQQRPMYNRLMCTASSVTRDMALGTVQAIGGFASINPSGGNLSYEVFPSNCEGAYARLINTASAMSSIKGYIHTNVTAGVDSVVNNIGTSVNGVLANRSYGTGILGVLSNGDYLTCSPIGNSASNTSETIHSEYIYVERLKPLSKNRASFISQDDSEFSGAKIGFPIAKFSLSYDTDVACSNTVLLKGNLILKLNTGNLYQIICNDFNTYSAKFLGHYDVEFLSDMTKTIQHNGLIGDSFYDIGESLIN